LGAFSPDGHWIAFTSKRTADEQRFFSNARPQQPTAEPLTVVINWLAAFQVPDFVDDATRAVRFVRHRAREFGIDGQRLAVAGSSAGGLIALLIAMRAEGGNAASEDAVERVSSRVQVVGCCVSPTDLSNGGGSENIVDVLRQRGAADPSVQFQHVDRKIGARAHARHGSEDRTPDAP
jgi:poly(3-hydroxybutyrate) depolymerase